MLNNRVRDFRELHGLSQDELARRVGISPTVIVQLEGDPQHTPQMRTAIRLCRFFNVDLGRLFWLDRDDGDSAETIEEPEPETVPA